VQKVRGAEQLVVRVKDIVAGRIDGNLQSIRAASLLYVPEVGRHDRQSQS
jgi:hypothetical protein